MKRSEINRYIAQATDFFAANGFRLPPFAFWTPEHWLTVGQSADEIRDCGLGWDVTDFGSGQFESLGLLLFTVRNGRPGHSRYGKLYAEKIMVVRENQVTPWHFHHRKTEDIINRGGGRLIIELQNSNAKGEFAFTPVQVSCDGVVRHVAPGGKVSLAPGESITLVPGLYHQFYGETGKGTVMVGEVSSVNDDAADNRFHQPLPRFPTIEEDQPPLHLLCNEYPAAS